MERRQGDAYRVGDVPFIGRFAARLSSAGATNRFDETDQRPVEGTENQRLETGGARGDKGPSSGATRNAPMRYRGEGTLVVSNRSMLLPISRTEGSKTFAWRIQQAPCRCDFGETGAPSGATSPGGAQVKVKPAAASPAVAPASATPAKSIPDYA